MTDRTVQARHLAVTGGTDETVDLAADAVRVDASERRVGARSGRYEAPGRRPGTRCSARGRARGAPGTRYDRYNAAIDALLALIVQVGDESNLTLDPDLDTYYLMDTLQFRLPVLLDVAGRSVDRAVLAGTGPRATDTDVFIELGLDNGVLSSTRKVDQPGGAAPWRRRRPTRDVRQAALDHFAGSMPRWPTLGGGCSPARSRAAGPPPCPPTPPTAYAPPAARFAADAAAGLDRLLRTRIDRFSARAHQVGIGTGAGRAAGRLPVRRLLPVGRRDRSGGSSRRCTRSPAAT